VSIVQVNTAAMPAFISSVVHAKTGAISSSPITPAQITLTVLNGGGVTGAASAASGALDKIGFHTGTPLTTAAQSTTTVNYPAAQAAAAKVVAGYLPGSKLVESSNLSQIQVVLGGDHIGVDAGAGAAVNKPTSTPTNSPTNTYTAQSCIN
jgi:hypothetical protein